jgi:hypothetical protein
MLALLLLAVGPLGAIGIIGSADALALPVAFLDPSLVVGHDGRFSDRRASAELASYSGEEGSREDRGAFAVRAFARPM